MKFVLLSVALILCGVNAVSANPTPQFFGGYPWAPLGNWIQQFQNSFTRFPSFPNFQGGSWNQNRPIAPAPFAPNTPQPLPIQPPQMQSIQQIAPLQPNVPTLENPDYSVANNGWYWQNWLPVPIIPQYSQDQPTIVIISRPVKKPAQENTINTVSSESGASANSSSVQMTNISVMVPSSNESLANKLSDGLNSNETTTTQNVQTTPLTSSAQTSGRQ